MTEEAKRCVEMLRKATYKDTGYSCNACPIYLLCPSGTVEFDGICMIHKAADLIESLSEQLDRVTRERDAAVAAFESNKRCETCSYYGHGENGQWRGVEKEVEG